MALAELEASLAVAREQRETLARQLEGILQRGQLVQRLAEAARCRQERDRLRQSLAHQSRGERQRSSLEAQLRALPPGDPGAAEARMGALGEEIARLELERRTLATDMGAVRARCAAISAVDPGAAVERERLALQEATAERDGLRRRADALLLLRGLFADARSDLAVRYSEPLARAIDEYLEPLLPGGAGTQLTSSQSTGFGGLRLRRGTEVDDFHQLSGGRREQFTAALPLTMADVLCSGHDGCLPLVFDEAFTHSDPRRFPRLRPEPPDAAPAGAVRARWSP